MNDLNAMEIDEEDATFAAFAADILSAYVSNNPVSTTELPKVIREVFSTLAEIEKGQGSSSGKVVAETPKPAIDPKRSITDDYIICLEDGKKFKSLKRHLTSQYNMTPEEYRQKWGLPSNYPMVAPNYAAARSALARRIGLGRKPGMRR